MFYPLTGGKLVNVLAVKYTPGHGRTYDGPWVESTTGDAVVKLFEGWESHALTLIKVCSNNAACTSSVFNDFCLP